MSETLFIHKGFVCRWLDGPDCYGNVVVREATVVERLFHRWLRWRITA